VSLHDAVEIAGIPVIASASAPAGRVEQIAGRVAAARRWLGATLGMDVEVTVFLLSDADWEGHAEVPVPGIPHTAGGERLILGLQPLPIATALHGLIGRLRDDAALDVLTRRYGPLEPAAFVPFADLFAVHELGHLYHEQVPFAFPRLWLQEFFATLCMYGYVASHEPEALPTLESMADVLTAGVDAAALAHHTLADYEALYDGVGVEEFGWYHLQFIAAAAFTWRQRGEDALRGLHRGFRDIGAITEPDLAIRLSAHAGTAAGRIAASWPLRPVADPEEGRA
jgi:hypothetical protein